MSFISIPETEPRVAIRLDWFGKHCLGGSLRLWFLEILSIEKASNISYFFAKVQLSYSLLQNLKYTLLPTKPSKKLLFRFFNCILQELSNDFQSNFHQIPTKKFWPHLLFLFACTVLCTIYCTTNWALSKATWKIWKQVEGSTLWNFKDRRSTRTSVGNVFFSFVITRNIGNLLLWNHRSRNGWAEKWFTWNARHVSAEALCLLPPSSVCFWVGQIENKLQVPKQETKTTIATCNFALITDSTLASFQEVLQVQLGS